MQCFAWGDFDRFILLSQTALRRPQPNRALQFVEILSFWRFLPESQQHPSHPPGRPWWTTSTPWPDSRTASLHVHLHSSQAV